MADNDIQKKSEREKNQLIGQKTDREKEKMMKRDGERESKGGGWREGEAVERSQVLLHSLFPFPNPIHKYQMRILVIRHTLIDVRSLRKLMLNHTLYIHERVRAMVVDL